MALTRFGGTFNALSYGYGNAGAEAGALQVISGSTVAGTYTLICQPVNPYTGAGLKIPISSTTPISIGGDSHMETVTPTSVSVNNLNQLLITATFTYEHGTGAQVSSGTFGLQEAINAAAAYGGGLVAVDGAWFKAGGSLAIINAVTPGAGVAVINNMSGASTPLSVQVPLTLAQVQAAFTTPVVLIPAQGAGTFIDVIDATVQYIYGSAAYSGGGAASINYVNAAGLAATGTIAAAVLTGLAAPSTNKVLAVAITNQADAAVVNKPVVYTNATANFTVGTGGSAIVNVTYKVVGGLS